MNKTLFDSKSPGFITTVLSAIFAITASFGIEYGLPSDQLAGDIVFNFTNGGLFAIGALLLTNVVGPIVNFIKKKQAINWRNVLSSTTTIVSVGGIVVAAFVYILHINIPLDAPQQIVDAVNAKSWTALVGYAITNIVIPIVRYFKAKKALTAG